MTKDLDIIKQISEQGCMIIVGYNCTGCPIKKQCDKYFPRDGCNETIVNDIKRLAKRIYNDSLVSEIQELLNE